MKHILITIFVLLSCAGGYLYLRRQNKSEPLSESTVQQKAKAADAHNDEASKYKN